MLTHQLNSIPDRSIGERRVSGNIKPTLQNRRPLDDDAKDFSVKKTFGISILLKLTQKSINGIEISESNGRYHSNLGSEEMNRAVNMTVKAHNIHLKAG